MSCPVVLEDLHKSFGTLKVIDGISTRIEAGTFVSVLGPSGCGKSTLLQILSGLMMPDSGRVRINGSEATGIPGQVGFMQQKDLLLPWKRVLENVTLPLTLKGMKADQAKEIVLPYMESFGLAGFETSWPDQLSGGMRQRAALLRTYMFRQDVLLLDEPFGALDDHTRFQLQQLLLRIRRKKELTLLFITHNIEEALILGDRIAVLGRGRIISDRPVELPRPRDPLTESFSRAFFELRKAFGEAVERKGRNGPDAPTPPDPS